MTIQFYPGTGRSWGRGRLRSLLVVWTCRHREWTPWRYETELWFEYLAQGEDLVAGCWRSCRRCRATEWVR